LSVILHQRKKNIFLLIVQWLVSERKCCCLPTEYRLHGANDVFVIFLDIAEKYTVAFLWTLFVVILSRNISKT